MKEFFDNILSGIGIIDILDIAIVAFCVYKILGFIHRTRAEQLVKGILILLVVMVLSGVFHFYTINWILKATLAVGIIAIVVIFQPELRRGLEHMGRGRLFSEGIQADKEHAKKTVGEFVHAIEAAAESRTGILLVIERNSSLTDVIETGTIIDAEISAEMIGTIFYEGSPLHDGAVIVRDNKLYSAGCVLPLSANPSLPTELGTRHRAGLGISERTDALVIIVSEETGNISMARDGKLERYLEDKNVEKALLEIYLQPEQEKKSGTVRKAIDRVKEGRRHV